MLRYPCWMPRIAFHLFVRRCPILVLSRRASEKILLGNNICITICRISGSVVRVGIEAPKDVRVLREELEDFPEEVQLAIT